MPRESETAGCSPSESRRPTRREWLWLLLPAVVLVLFRLHAFGGPLETDECNYAFVASRLLAGDRLYVDVWDHQPPGVFVLFAGLIALAGDSETAIRLFAVLWSLATLVLVYVVARQGLRPGGAWFAGLLFAIASSDPGMAGEGANREIFMNTLVVGSVACLMRPTLVRVLLAGVLLAAASTMKTVVAAQWLALLIALWAGQASGGQRAIPQLARTSLAFIVGPTLIWAGVGGYFAATGRFAVFRDAVFTYNLTYSQMEAGFFGRFAEFFRSASWPVFKPALSLWLAGGLGFGMLLLTRNRQDRAWAAGVLGCVAGSFVAVCLPRQFWSHYYLLMLPGLTILAATVFDILGQRGDSTPRRGGGPASVMVIGYGLTVAVPLLVTQGLYYLLAPTDRVGFQRYGDRMLWGRDQARRLASVTEPDDFVFVWGIADAGFYYYSDRRCATRFTMIGALLGDDPSALARQSLLIDDLARTRPRVILQMKQFPPVLDQFVREHGYGEAGRDRDRMIVLCRADQPIRPVDWNGRLP